MADNFEAEKSIYAGSYQSLDGSNYTMAGIDVKFADSQDGSASFLIGGGTDFNKKCQFITDMNGKLNYTNVFNLNARLRTKVGSINGETSQSCEFRLSPISADIPVGKNTSIYATPYYLMKTDMHGDTKHSIGAFTGLNQKFSSKTSGFIELERYNLQKHSDWQKNTSINVGLRVKF